MPRKPTDPRPDRRYAPVSIDMRLDRLRSASAVIAPPTFSVLPGNMAAMFADAVRDLAPRPATARTRPGAAAAERPSDSSPTRRSRAREAGWRLHDESGGGRETRPNRDVVLLHARLGDADAGGQGILFLHAGRLRHERRRAPRPGRQRRTFGPAPIVGRGSAAVRPLRASGFFGAGSPEPGQSRLPRLRRRPNNPTGQKPPAHRPRGIDPCRPSHAVGASRRRRPHTRTFPPTRPSRIRRTSRRRRTPVSRTYRRPPTPSAPSAGLAGATSITTSFSAGGGSRNMASPDTSSRTITAPSPSAGTPRPWRELVDDGVSRQSAEQSLSCLSEEAMAASSPRRTVPAVPPDAPRTAADRSPAARPAAPFNTLNSRS